MFGAAFVLQSRRVVTPEGLRPARIVVDGGRIVGVDPIPPPDEPSPVPERGPRVEDVGDRLVLPGLVDTHVHVNEPGRTEWEGFATATRAAALGGVTTLVDMPLNSEPTTTTAAVARKRAAAEAAARVDVAAWGGLVPASVDRVDELAAAGVLGFKAFLVDSGIPDFPPVDEEALAAAMPRIAGRGLPLLVHAESAAVIGERASAPPAGARRSFAAWAATRPARAEVEAIELLSRLAADTGCRVHVVHVSSAEGAARIAAARVAGVPIGGETCPHYLLWRAADVADGDTAFKCAPPLRSATDRDALWAALAAGALDLVATDHSPAPPALRCLDRGDFFEAWGGIASLGLALPVLWAAASRREVPIERLARWLASGPARLAGLETKGEIRAGADADLVVFDPEPTWVVGTEHLRFRHALSPYVGVEARGRVDAVFLRGEPVVARGEVTGDPGGRWIERQEACG